MILLSIALIWALLRVWQSTRSETRTLHERTPEPSTDTLSGTSSSRSHSAGEL